MIISKQQEKPNNVFLLKMVTKDSIILFFLAKVLTFKAMNSDFVLLFILSSSNDFKNADSNNMICIHDEKVEKCISGLCFIFPLLPE